MKNLSRAQLIFGGGIAGGLLLVIAVFYLLWQIFSGPPPAANNTVWDVTLVTPPPPPPEIERPEEPEEPEVEEQIEEPEPDPDPIAENEAESEELPGDDLGLDADGEAGSDAFGLAARRGGRGLLDGGSPYDYFAKQVKRAIENAILAKDEFRKKEYSVVVHIWLDSSGNFIRYELNQGSGDPDLDKAITALLGEVRAVDEALPAGMPQPLRMRIRSRL
jgi:hypothetical protein